MERSDWLIRKLGGWSKPPPKKRERFVWVDKKCCDWSDKNDVIVTGIYSIVRRFLFKKDGDGQVYHAGQRDE